MMDGKEKEWLKQADYDFETARYMFAGGRYFYAVFMCHLSLEKALKGLFYKKKKEIPLKVHNLIFFLNKMELKPPEAVGRFIVRINEASVTARYPEDIEKISRDYTKNVVMDILSNCEEVLKWVRKQY